MSEFDILNRYMQFIVPDCNSRILGQQNVHFNILDVIAYWNDPQTPTVWGDYTVRTVVDRENATVAPVMAILVDNIQMGQDFPVSLYFWGWVPGVNTIVSRYQWWKLYVISGIRQNIINRLQHKTGQTFVPVADRVGVLTESPLLVFK